MKSMLKLPLLAVALALAAPFTFAQEKDAPPPPPAGEHGGQHKGGPRMDPLKMLTEKLGLTEAQQAQIKPILDERKKEMDAVRADTSLERDAKMAKAAEIFKTYQPKIRALLTPEQQKKFDDMKEEFMGGRGGGQRKEKGEKAKE
jgi:Spy/CpxP family protein refolding chaperone